MKPKILCASCSTEVQWGDKFCPSCGTAVDWPAANASSPESSQSGKPHSKTSITVTSFVSGGPCKTCGSENPAGTDFCHTCGAALEGGKGSASSASKKQPAKAQKQATAVPVVNSWKLVVGFFVFLGAGIVLMQIFSGTRRTPVVPQQQITEQPTANMQAIPQIQEMEKQLAANPNDHQLLLQLANVLHDNRFYDEAIKRYKDYLSKHPKDANARVDLGICYKETGRLDEARKEMETAIQNDPKHLFAHYNLGIVYLSGGNVEKANEMFKKVIALDPKSEVGQRAQQLLTQHNPQNLQPN